MSMHRSYLLRKLSYLESIDTMSGEVKNDNCEPFLCLFLFVEDYFITTISHFCNAG
jgi:hypothetical protein